MNKLFLYSVLSSTLFLASCSTKHWGYSGDTSAEHWGELSKNFALCKTGMAQSPINITAAYKTSNKPLQYHYQIFSGKLINNGHTIQYTLNNQDNYVIVDEEPFYLKQFHIHTPSEHTINGQFYPLETHFVHANKEGELLVIAVMFELGKENPIINKILTGITKEINISKEIESFNFNELIANRNSSYYRFDGSLTTPPCTEGVRWIVYKKPSSFSKAQLENIKTVLDYDNNRPLQKINARVIVES